MWKSIWRLPVKTKLKHFLWRCIHNWLATSSVIKQRGMVVDDICKRCEAGIETREHLFFFHYDASAEIWKLAPLSWEGVQAQTSSFEEWWRRICLGNKNPAFQERMEFTVNLCHLHFFVEFLFVKLLLDDLVGMPFSFLQRSTVNLL